MKFNLINILFMTALLCFSAAGGLEWLAIEKAQTAATMAVAKEGHWYTLGLQTQRYNQAQIGAVALRAMNHVDLAVWFAGAGLVFGGIGSHLHGRATKAAFKSQIETTVKEVLGISADKEITPIPAKKDIEVDPSGLANGRVVDVPAT